MRILQIRFKNLNSLAGEWAIDLTHPAFLSDGIFVITGPTGAGKSTVPMLVMMLCWCIIRVIYVTVAVKFFPVLRTVSWAYPITWGLSTLVFTLYYFKADWMHAFERREKHA